MRITNQVAALGQVLPQEAVGVLVGTALLGVVRIGEVDLNPGFFRQGKARRHFLTTRNFYLMNLVNCKFKNAKIGFFYSLVGPVHHL